MSTFKYGPSFPRKKDLTHIVLREGPHDGVVLPIKPTMKNLWWKGEHYFAMESSRSKIDLASDLDEYYAMPFLWAKWWDEKLGKFVDVTDND